MPAVGPVQRGGLVQVGIDRLQPGQQRDGEEGHAAPGVHRDRAPHAVDAVGQERDLVHDEARPEEEPVQHAERRIEHPPPGERREHGRDDERQQHRGAQETLAAEAAIEQHGQRHAERQLEDRGPERVEERVAERLLEDRVVPGLREVLQADEMADVADARVREREPDARDERVGDERPEQHDRRRQQQRGQQPLALEKARQPPGALGARMRQRHHRRAIRSARDRFLHAYP